ncbi:MAG TPA: hypothetical protein VG944_05090 [Fimbriimonas sp.]|nr:hypothetical protein [Fimbriimonas sp.]
MNDSLYRLFGWLIPIAVLLGAGVVIYQQSQALQQAELRHSNATADLQHATEQKAMVLALPQAVRYAATGAGPSEETAFLDDLRLKAHETGTTISSWTSKTSNYTTNTSPVVLSPKEMAVLKDMTRITCDLTVKGPYPALRHFVSRLTDTDRLFNVANINWKRTDAGTELNMSLVRYVGSAAATNTASAARPAGTSL